MKDYKLSDYHGQDNVNDIDDINDRKEYTIFFVILTVVAMAMVISSVTMLWWML